MVVLLMKRLHMHYYNYLMYYRGTFGDWNNSSHYIIEPLSGDNTSVLHGLVAIYTGLTMTFLIPTVDHNTLHYSSINKSLHNL